MAEPEHRSAESSFSAPMAGMAIVDATEGTDATDTSSNAASLTSTPPTAVSPDSITPDNISLSSELSKAETAQMTVQDAEPLDINKRREVSEKMRVANLLLPTPDTDVVKSFRQAIQIAMNLSRRSSATSSEIAKDTRPLRGVENAIGPVEDALEQPTEQGEKGDGEGPLKQSERELVRGPTERAEKEAIEGQTRQTEQGATEDSEKDVEDDNELPTIVVAELRPVQPAKTTPKRKRRERGSLPTRHTHRESIGTPTYNLAKLAGTYIHGLRRAKGDQVRDKRRKTDSASMPSTATATPTPTSPASHPTSPATHVGDSIVALDLSLPKMRSSPRAAHPTSKARANNRIISETSTRKKVATASKPPARAKPSQRLGVGTRRSATAATSPAKTASRLGKRSRDTFERGNSKKGGSRRMSRELKRLQDTNEFAHIDAIPVVHTVWSKGRYVDASELKEEEPQEPEPARKRQKTRKDSEEETAVVASPAVAPVAAPAKRGQKRIKIWLEKGLYAGQEVLPDVTKTLTAQEKKKLVLSPDLQPSGEVNKALPMPIFNGFRQLLNGRDFKLPYDVCNPLPPGGPKPPSYRTMTKNRFIGDAAAYWKKTPHLEDYQSKCICSPEDGCGEQCQNRIMLYECDHTNCNIGKDLCTNRAFQDLTERTKKGGPFRIGVEVFKTADRGFGVRSNRTFEPREIITEYIGEIITEEECDRRMNEVYKDNECYYLMSFDQKMIIDATSGSMARFVNHSCSPNCEMIKWVVSGQPRMALFAGSRPIATGEELTYDYNFSPFSKDVQQCLCGSDNCRGVLGPKQREVKPSKDARAKLEAAKAKQLAKQSANGKRKLKELQGAGSNKANGGQAKKVKIVTTKAAVQLLSTNTGLKIAKSATALKAAATVTAVKRRVPAVSAKARAGVPSSTRKRPGSTAVTPNRRTSMGVLKTYGKSRRNVLNTKAHDRDEDGAESDAAPRPREGDTIFAASLEEDAIAVLGNGAGSALKKVRKSGTTAAKRASLAASVSSRTGSGRVRTPSRRSLEAAGGASTGSGVKKLSSAWAARAAKARTKFKVKAGGAKANKTQAEALSGLLFPNLKRPTVTATATVEKESVEVLAHVEQKAGQEDVEMVVREEVVVAVQQVEVVVAAQA